MDSWNTGTQSCSGGHHTPIDVCFSIPLLVDGKSSEVVPKVDSASIDSISVVQCYFENEDGLLHWIDASDEYLCTLVKVDQVLDTLPTFPPPTSSTNEEELSLEDVAVGLRHHIGTPYASPSLHLASWICVLYFLMAVFIWKTSPFISFFSSLYLPRSNMP